MTHSITTAAPIRPVGNPPENDDIARIRFGDGTGQELPVNLAAAILHLYWVKSPMQFGAVVRAAMIELWSDQDGGK